MHDAVLHPERFGHEPCRNTAELGTESLDHTFDLTAYDATSMHYVDDALGNALLTISPLDPASWVVS